MFCKIKIQKYKRALVIGLSFLAIILGFSKQDVRAQGAAPSMDLTIKDNESVPRSQQMAWVNEHSAQAKATYSHVQNLLDQARQEKDSIKITCLDDKLTQINVNLRGIETRKGAFQSSMSVNDSDSSNQHFTMLTIYSAKISSLGAEAESCIGGNDVVLGESDTTVKINEDITDEDPSIPNVDVYHQPVIDQLPHASGFY